MAAMATLRMQWMSTVNEEVSINGGTPKQVRDSLAHTKLTQLRTQDSDSVAHTKLTQLCTQRLGGPVFAGKHKHKPDSLAHTGLTCAHKPLGLLSPTNLGG